MAIHPPTHLFIHDCCKTLSICVCMGGHDPYYLDHTPFTEHFGVYQGTKPNLYHDPATNVKPSVQCEQGTDDHHYVQYLGH